MSYKRTFNKTIEVHYSGTVSYPPSQSGGTKSFSGTARENVQVTINVDTDPFDNSVKSCNNRVSALTAGVAATETAEIISIKENSLKIGNTVIKGFFNNIRLEVSSKIMELTKRVEALLMDIKEKSDRLMSIKGQMETDYQRLADRYGHLFTELNTELENRVVALDLPVFDTTRMISSSQSRLMESDLVNVVAVAGMENTRLNAQIDAALTKHHASMAIAEANNFLSSKQSSERTIQNCTIDQSQDAIYYVPACCLIANNDSNVNDLQVFVSHALPKSVEKQLTKMSAPKTWQQVSKSDLDTIARFFNEQVNQSYSNKDAHSTRVREMMSKLFNKNN